MRWMYPAVRPMPGTTASRMQTNTVQMQLILTHQSCRKGAMTGPDYSRIMKSKNHVSMCEQEQDDWNAVGLRNMQ